MNHNRLKQELKDFALVAFISDEIFFSSKQRGVASLVALCEKNIARDELSAADKVIGKAAALLCVLCNVKTLYAKVISQAALVVLEKHGVDVTYDEMVPFIMNREGDGACPMEKLALGVEDPSEMLRRVQTFIESMKA